MELRTGYRIPFSSPPPLSLVPFPMPSYSPSSIKGKAFQEEVFSLLEKEAIKWNGMEYVVQAKGPALGPVRSFSADRREK